MKKMLLLFLSLTLLVNVTGCAAAPQSESPPSGQESPQVESELPQIEGDLPQIGDELSGFVVKSITPMDVLGATGVLFEHTQTGAELLYLASEDTNRSFEIVFRTPALDDKGKPHVFEHMTICGSQKYPDANLFFPFANQTYNTFVNALTYHGATMYPVASLSEEQLMTMMDYYLSGVFTPLLYTEPRMVQREAWRYELTDVDAPITVTGTVYSEMQGALTLDAQAENNIYDSLFAGGAVSYVSGGLPEDIRTLTYDELVEFHDTYYHPSNALIVLYGDLDYKNYLSFIDKEYLSKYEKKEIYVEQGKIEPFTETQYFTFDAPVEASAQTENASVIYYSFGLPDAGLEEQFKLDLLNGVLTQETSPLMRTLRQQLPNANITIGIDMDMPVTSFSFVANGVNESDRDVFVKAVDDSIAELAKNGIDQNDLDAVLASRKLSLLQTTEDTQLGVDASEKITLSWAYFDRTDYYAVYENTLQQADAATLTELLKTSLADNTYRAVAVTRPVAGLAEENAAKLADELAQYKASLSQEELEALVQQSKDFMAWSAATPSAELIGQLVKADVQELPEEIIHYDVIDEEKDGVRYLSAEATTSGVVASQLLLDASTLPIERVQDVALYLNLLGNLDTTSHTKEDLSALVTRYLNNFEAALGASPAYDPKLTDLYVMNLGWIGLVEDVPQSVALLKELLLDTQLTDAAVIRDQVTRMANSIYFSIQSNPLNAQLARAQAAFLPTSAFGAHVNYIAYYNYLQELLALDDEQLLSRLESAKELTNNRHDAIVVCAGDQNAIQTAQSELGELLAGMPDVEREKTDYSSLLLDIDREALVVNSTVQMNLIADKAENYTAKYRVAAALLQDMYLLPQLRNAMGAYGAFCNFDPYTNALYTYRDPNLANTYSVFETIPEYLRTVELTQGTVDSYIIGSYSALARPSGALSGALSAAFSALSGMDETVKLQFMKEAKSTTVEDIRAFADAMETLITNGVRSTSATESTVQANAGLFDTVLRLNETVGD